MTEYIDIDINVEENEDEDMVQLFKVGFNLRTGRFYVDMSETFKYCMTEEESFEFNEGLNDVTEIMVDAVVRELSEMGE